VCGASVLLLYSFTAPSQRLLGADAAPAADCHARIILGFTQAMPAPPDEKWVQELAAASGVTLRYLRAITPSLYVFRMSAANAAGDCAAAIERLRRDARVRSAEIDRRREHETG
jgi:hypothetical protein